MFFQVEEVLPIWPYKNWGMNQKVRVKEVKTERVGVNQSCSRKKRIQNSVWTQIILYQFRRQCRHPVGSPVNLLTQSIHNDSGQNLKQRCYNSRRLSSKSSSERETTDGHFVYTKTQIWWNFSRCKLQEGKVKAKRKLRLTWLAKKWYLPHIARDQRWICKLVGKVWQ